ncbi:FAD-dependent oxidoreductase [Evansella cellulosilytica]|uniref:FAD dependent oxidoreductase n=1 Tax=Evansella cellulosilytica (strain ATCC 21833 / DSM 2522 / FERM P-1141 / JCM 9156 / N-4) TaxID=649639 RepID=E6TY77_EVAC2|nr:FAD-dependent oxidoreductase [Evansella cellulosilytica]ADU32396.1 FAD dependent oxidoreductase [Evansella cellulosilytica DSM 2522]
MEKNYEGLPQYPESYWLDSTNRPSFHPLKENKHFDIVIVGGGIAGITTGYLLSQEGLKVAILEATQIFNGTTGHTTAKVTAQHNLLYDELIEHFGEGFAKTYYESNMNAVGFIRNFIESHQLQCDFQEKDAVLYGAEAKSVRKLEKEYAAYQKLGIPSELTDTVPFGVRVEKALVMKNQAQFHPLQYLGKMVDEFLANGGEIFEGTVATSIMTESQTGEDRLHVETQDGHFVSCHKVMACTHFPFYEGEGYYFMRMHPERSYIVAAKPNGNMDHLTGMYLSVDSPSRSVRTVTINGETHLLLAGDGHKTGQGEPEMKHYEALKKFGEDVFQVTSFPYRWSAQDLYTQDNVPYIGPVSANETNIFVATGFRKWGMSSSTVAAHILRDYALEKDTPEMEVYSTERFHADPSLKHFFKENLNVAKHFLKGKLDQRHQAPDKIQRGEAGIIHINGSRAGAYRDEKGTLHCVDTTCTHMGCEVEWNGGERTWDCPCHGSRFTFDGDVVEGPAKKGLRKVSPEEETLS